MSELFTAAGIHFAKELRIEARTREITVLVAMFSLLLVILASLAFYIDPATSRTLAPGVLWIPIAFAGVLASSRTWARERENHVMRAILAAPSARAGIYLGKLGALMLFISVVEVLLVPAVAVLFHLDLVAILPRLAAILLTGTLAFASASTLFGALTVETRARDLTLSIVVFPLVAPALLAAVVATRDLFGGAPPSDTWNWIKILLAFDLVFLVGGLVLFEPLTSE